MNDRVFYWEFHERGFQQAVRWGKWKAVRLQQDGPTELFDLKTDPGETQNVAQQQPEIVAEGERYFEDLRNSSADWPVKGEEDLTENSP